MKLNDTDSHTPILRLLVIGPGNEPTFLQRIYSVYTGTKEVTLGSGNDAITLKITSLHNGETAYVLGDGINPIPIALLNKAMAYVADGARIDFLGHGNHKDILDTSVKPYDRTHTIDLVKETQITQEVAASALQSPAVEVHFWSCYGGTDRKRFLQNTPPNTTVYMHAGAANLH